MDTVNVLDDPERRQVRFSSTRMTMLSSPQASRFTKTDLTGIALRENLVVAGSPILNTPVIGALAIHSASSAGNRE